ncbi:hydrogen peroxide-inducible genes activator [Parasphingorhabdus sp.]|jgi:LysR family hydrogen peroxide-inducible transcriptional activator|uniref:hydrogen peroxide-inducible genes activator n=1 Tax=Parasphingorhabdus sp. TaxID=2709688 RepID=UPI0007F3B9A4|nr:hyaluronan synthase [Sphingomonadales bacterium EhC05]
MPTLRQFEYLVAVADHRHFGKAAQAAAASQPTLSHQLRTLEQRLGVTLVERRTHGAELTPVGREIAERARSVLVQVKDIRDLAERASDSLAGTLRFGVSPTLGPYLMPPVIAALHRTRPDLRFYMREGIPDLQAMELVKGSIDMLLGPLPIEGENLQIEPLFREPLILVAPPDHALASRPSLSLADLRGVPVLSLDRRHHLHRDVAAQCQRYDMNLLRDYEGTSLDSVRQMVASGLGLAILPALYVRSELGRGGDVAVLDVSGWEVTRSIGAAWRSNAGFAEEYGAIATQIADEARLLMEN